MEDLMSEKKITKLELITQLTQIWESRFKDINYPFVFMDDHMNKDFQYDMDKSFLTFTCCSKNHKQILPPSAIIKLVQETDGKIICPICKSENMNSEIDDDDLPLPGEEVAGIVMTEQEKDKLKEEFMKMQEESKQTEDTEQSVENVEENIIETIEEEDLSEEDSTIEENGVYVTEVQEINNEDDEEPVEENEDDLSEEEIIEEDNDNEEIEEGIAEDDNAVPEDEPEEVEKSLEEIQQEKMDNINETVAKFLDELKYETFDHIEYDIKTDLVTVKCRLCGTTHDIKYDEFDNLYEIEPDYVIYGCPTCSESIVKSYEEFNIKRNTAFKDHIKELLEERNFELLITKGQLFKSPFEKIQYNDLNKGTRHYGRIIDILSSAFGVEDDEDFIKEEIKDITPVEVKPKEEKVEVIDLDKVKEEIEAKSEESVTEKVVESEEAKENKPIYYSNKIQLMIDGELIGDDNEVSEEKSDIKVEVIDIPKEVKQEPKPKVNVEVFKSSTGIELDLGNECLGKPKPEQGKKNRSAGDNDPFKGAHVQDPLQQHVNDRKKELEKEWYNTKVNAIKTPGFNELADEDSLVDEFKESKMGKAILMAIDKSDCEYKLYLNDATMELPIIDVSSGVRCMCLDIDDISQLQVPLDIERTIPFSYKKRDDEKTKYRKIYMYSDSVSNAKKFKATVKAITKIFSRNYTFDKRRIVNLSGNYMLSYVTDHSAIKDFDNENSVYPMGKPKTSSIAIIAMKYETNMDKKFGIRDVFEYYRNQGSFSMKKYNLRIVASAKYIAAPNFNDNTVKYIITDYTELTATIFLDGFKHVVGAIIKEHMTKYPTLSYTMQFEFDPSLMMSPSLEKYYDDGTFVQFGANQDTQYIRKTNFRSYPEDFYRQDTRLFTIKSLAKRFNEEIKRMGYNITITSQRERFIDSLGFVKVYQPSVRSFLLNPVFTFGLLYETSIMCMNKIDLDVFFEGPGVYSGGYDNLLFQRLLLEMMTKDTDNNEE
jgi:hypothetical protein